MPLIPIITMLLATFATHAIAQKSVAPSGNLTTPAGLSELSKELRKEIETKMLEQDPCYPNCATLERLDIKIAGEKLELLMRFHLIAATTIPLPINSEDLWPEQIEVSQVPLLTYKSPDNKVYANLPSGIQDVKIVSGIVRKDLITLNLPMIPKFANVTSDAYRVVGIGSDGTVSANLQFMKKNESSFDKPIGSNLTPLYKITRDITVGLESTVTTTIERQSPLGVPIVAEIQLLDGEDVITPGTRTQNRKAVVSIDPQSQSLSWTSRLNIVDSLKLEASDSKLSYEVWRINVTPLWHFEVVENTAALLAKSASDGYDLSFKPWPGQKTTLRLSQPPAIDAPSFTIESSLISISPGTRSRDATIKISASASRGVQHVIEIPAEWNILSSTVNGESKDLLREGKLLTLPFLPGKTDVEINFRSDADFPTVFNMPRVSFNVPSVNSEMQFVLPPTRWLLWTGGDSWGPVILFWSHLVIATILAIIFSTLRLAPVAFPSWLLLNIGLTQVGPLEMLIPGATLLAFGLRQKLSLQNNILFNSKQLLLALLTLATCGIFYVAIKRGLLGVPHMYVFGNGSSATSLLWYKDRVSADLFQPFFISVPLIYYRGAMLLWSLWLAWALLKWVPWMWHSFSKDFFWKKSVAKPKNPTVAPISDNGPTT